MNKNKIYKKWWFWLMAILFLVFIGSLAQSDVEDTNPSSSEAGEVLNYKTIEVRDLHIGNTGKRYQYLVHVSKPAEVENLKKIAEEVLEKAKKDTPFNALAIHFYNDPEAANTTNGQAIYAPNGEWGDYSEVSTGDYSNMSFSYRNLEPVTEEVKEDKFGLTTEERKQVYWETVEAEDKAYVEAEEMYPTDATKVDMETAQNNLDKNIEKERELAEQYKSEVRDKWGLTEEQMSEISMEGVEKKWPVPELN